MRAWIDENRENLRTRARLKEDRTEWLKRNKDPELLGIPSLRLKEAQELSEEPGDVRIDDIQDYIKALLDHDRQRKEAEETKQREELHAARRRTRIAAAAAALLLLVAVLAGREAWVANEQKAVADRQTAAALNNETHALAALSHAAAREGRPLDGVELALAAWPRHAGVSERPMLADAIQYVSLSFSEHPPVAVLNHEGPVTGVLYSPDGQRILSWSDDKTLRLWDAATGAAIGEPMRHKGPVHGALYSSDGRASFRGLTTRRLGSGTRRRARRSTSQCRTRCWLMARSIRRMGGASSRGP